jgi:hypothetical protein
VRSCRSCLERGQCAGARQLHTGSTKLVRTYRSFGRPTSKVRQQERRQLLAAQGLRDFQSLVAGPETLVMKHGEYTGGEHQVHVMTVSFHYQKRASIDKTDNVTRALPKVTVRR